MIQHDSRSVMSVDVPKLVRRLELCLRYVLADKGFQQRHADRAHVLKAHHYAYIALHAVLAKDKKTGLSYLLKTVHSQPSFVFSRKFLAICKHLLR
jgi:hypothetical protein